MDVGADLIRYNRLVSLSGEYFRRLRG